MWIYISVIVLVFIILFWLLFDSAKRTHAHRKERGIKYGLKED